MKQHGEDSWDGLPALPCCQKNLRHGICMADDGGGVDLPGPPETARLVPGLRSRPDNRVIGDTPTDARFH